MTYPIEPVTPSTRAAQRARSQPRERVESRAYPFVAVSRDPDALSVELAATQALLRAASASEVVAIVATLIHDLGGALIPARYVDPATVVPLDVSLGLSEPLMPFAGPVSITRMRLEAILPGFLETARTVLERVQIGAQEGRQPALDHQPGAMARRTWMQQLEKASPGDSVCLVKLIDLKVDQPDDGPLADRNSLLDATALMMHRTLQPDVCTARYDRDGLMCLAPGLAGQDLLSGCELFRDAWARERPAGGRGIELSIGVAEVGGGGGRAALGSAASAMRQARAAGGNRTVMVSARDAGLGSAMRDHSDAPADYFRAVTEFDVREASDVVVALLDGGTSVQRIITEVLAPAQVRAGELWESGTWSVADEHAATAVAEGALSALILAAGQRPGPPVRHAAVACAEGEWHSLPARMAAAVAGATGEARITMLGPSMPPDQLHRRLSLGDIDVLALSCTIPTNLVGAARCIGAAHELDVPVIVGGSAFGDTPTRARALGADGWALDAAVLLGPIPELTGHSVEISNEVLLLDHIDEAIITFAYDRTVGLFPRLANMTRHEQARTREDLQWMARFAGAALLTEDTSITDDLLTWMCRLLRGKVPAHVITQSARVLAETLEPQAPAGAAILGDTAAKVEANLKELQHHGTD